MYKGIDLDTINHAEIEELIEKYPISEISSNPAVIYREGRVDFVPHMKRIREIVGKDMLIHCQVVSTNYQGMLDDADCIMKTLGENTHVKIPMNETGVHVIKSLTRKGIPVTATALHSVTQGINAVLAGASTLAYYYTRMMQHGINPEYVFKSIRKFIDDSNNPEQITLMGAGIIMVKQMEDVFRWGGNCVAIAPDVLRASVHANATEEATAGFVAKWEEMYGIGTTVSTVCQ